MLTYLLDWLGLLLRWLHLVAGIAWIGASFYFVWLDNHLLAPAVAGDSAAGVAGELWAVHGGGFYRSQKYRVAPPLLPATLHWFYWEAYVTWLSGFALLCLLYFWRAEAYLIDPAVAPLDKPTAIALAVAALLLSWLLYDALCRSRLGRHAAALGAVLALAFSAEAWGLCQLYSGRGAFMVFGAALGTIMVANVLFVIIPGQRELVHAKRQGREPDPAPGLRGKQRSVHNTYFTLPVLFVMISNHYAMTYGARYNWLVLIAMCAAGASIRAWFVARHHASRRGGRTPALPAILGALSVLAVILALAPTHGQGGGSSRRAAAGLEPLSAQWIIAARCTPCHAQAPTQPGFSAAPNGLILESLDQLKAHLPEVRQQVLTRAMPLGNLTGITEQERAVLLAWVAQAAGP
ncbi:MAG: urate hydroxylase PuuD [Steroidobacteraceae bacterium]